jgi:ribosome-binding protein aMBF1 (putative translation factor)
MDMTQEAGTAGVVGPDTGPVTLRDVLAANRALARAQETETEKRRHRDDMIRAALRQEVASQAELARELKLSEMQVSRIREGKTSGRIRPE